MHMRTLLAFLVASLLALQLHAEPLAVFFESSAVVVTGVANGHQVAIFSVALESRAFNAALVRRFDILQPTSGIARYTLTGNVPPRSVWIAIDRVSGESAAAAPPNFPPRQVNAPADLVLRGSTDVLQIPFGIAEVLILRPGDGVWIDEAASGGAHDSQHGRGKLWLPVSAARHAGETTDDLKNITAADVIVAIEPNTLAFFIVRVGERP